MIIQFPHQSNRLKLRIDYGDKTKKLAHTLNGSALALPRIIAALIENNQTDKGITIPKALHSYTRDHVTWTPLIELQKMTLVVLVFSAVPQRTGFTK